MRGVAVFVAIARTLLFGRHLLNECQVENLEIHFDRLSREYQFHSI